MGSLRPEDVEAMGRSVTLLSILVFVVVAAVQIVGIARDVHAIRVAIEVTATDPAKDPTP